MQMLALLNKFIRANHGTAVLEFAIVLPVLLLIAVGMTDVGRALYQANALDKGLRAGAVYAAHKTFPLSQAVKDEVENIVKTGNPQGALPYLATVWMNGAAAVNIQELSFDLGGQPVPIVRVTASAPFDPFFNGLVTLFGASAFTFSLSHEQAYIGE